MKILYNIENIYILKIEVISIERINKVVLKIKNNDKENTIIFFDPTAKVDLEKYPKISKLSVEVYKENGEKISCELQEDFYKSYPLDTGKGTLRNKPVLIIGVSKDSGFIKKVLERSYWIHGFLTDNKNLIGRTYFDIPIFDIDNNDFNYDNYKLVTPFRSKEDVSYYNKKHYNIEYYNKNFNSDNIVINALYGKSMIDLYELSNWCVENLMIESSKLISQFIKFKFNSELAPTVQLGEGVSFGYGGIGIVIHKNAIIGDYTKISQNVTIGQRSAGRRIIGKNSFIGPGSKVYANIGDNVIVGGNSVILDDVPDNTVVAGVPARVISQDIEKYKKQLPKKIVIKNI